MKNNLRPILIITGLFVAANCHAGVLVLKNGDRITGEISRIWDAEVTIEPTYAGDEFTVDMAAIEHIESDQTFEIDLADGRLVVASGRDDRVFDIARDVCASAGAGIARLNRRRLSLEDVFLETTS